MRFRGSGCGVVGLGGTLLSPQEGNSSKGSLHARGWVHPPSKGMGARLFVVGRAGSGHPGGEPTRVRVCGGVTAVGRGGGWASGWVWLEAVAVGGTPTS